MSKLEFLGGRCHPCLAYSGRVHAKPGSRALIVNANSASPQLPGVTYYGIEATHSGMCKFEGVDAPGYHTVSTAIREWVLEAPPVIQVRWAVEEEDRKERARQAINEWIQPFVSIFWSGLQYEVWVQPFFGLRYQ